MTFIRKVTLDWGNFCYTHFFKKVFFLFDPEAVHDFVTAFGRFLGNISFARFVLGKVFKIQDPGLRQTILGMEFKNPVGLAAGFDKDALLTQVLPAVGFGFEEIGSVTAKSHPGNSGQRLWRLPKHMALRVNYGLKNEGADAIYNRLEKLKFGFPVGISIAKTNKPETSEVQTGIADYVYTYKKFAALGNYFTINISCPNTCEEYPIFAKPENLDKLLYAIFQQPKTKPVFVKLSPDLSGIELGDLLQVCRQYPVDGFVCTNLTKKNIFGHTGRGGFSGKAVFKASNDMIKKVYQFFGGSKIIIGCGGVFSPEDAYEKIKSGASLIQLITGMIYRGPWLIAQINLGLLKLLRKDGFKNISEAVGVEAKA